MIPVANQDSPRKASLKTSRWFLFVGVVVIVVCVWHLFTGDTTFRQMHNMNIARAHLPVVRQKFDSFPEFSHLDLFVTTGAGGALMLLGSVPSLEDVKRIREAVEQTAPPVNVVYRITATNDFKQRK